MSGGGVGGGGGEWAVVLVTLSPLNCNLRAAAHGGDDRDDEGCLSGGDGGGDCGEWEVVLVFYLALVIKLLKITVV